jgi:hypothetical protein
MEDSTNHAAEITSDENFVKSKINVCDAGESDRDGHAQAAMAVGFFFFFFFESLNSTPG